jgi:hypothetical protein
MDGLLVEPNYKKYITIKKVGETLGKNVVNLISISSG